MSVDLSTSWLGLKLKHPVITGASPLVDNLDTVRLLEDSGAAAITMHSLFEEQLAAEQLAAHHHFDGSANASAESTNWFPSTSDFRLGPDAYLEQIRKVREAVSVPVIGSLNGSTPGGWLDYARLIEKAGAHAMELNLYALPSDAHEDGPAVEARQLEIIRAVRGAVKIPLAVKLSPFYSSLPNFVSRLETTGVNGIVLFNRLYQPDIDIENLALERVLHLSERTELLPRLRWLAVLSPNTKLSLAVSGGVHESVDVVKSLMAGAHTVQVVSELLRRGPRRLLTIIAGLKTWLEQKEYESVAQLTGSMNLKRCPDPSGYERANYVKLLQSWHGNFRLP